MLLLSLLKLPKQEFTKTNASEQKQSQQTNKNIYNKNTTNTIEEKGISSQSH